MQHKLLLGRRSSFSACARGRTVHGEAAYRHYGAPRLLYQYYRIYSRIPKPRVTLRWLPQGSALLPCLLSPSVDKLRDMVSIRPVQCQSRNMYTCTSCYSLLCEHLQPFAPRASTIASWQHRIRGSYVGEFPEGAERTHEYVHDIH